MKKLFKSIAVVAVVLISSGVLAQTKKIASVPLNEKSLLWEISGNGLSKSSYLYGTIHMICGNDYFLAEKTKKAFENSEKLVLEINYSDTNEMSDSRKSAMGREPLSKTLNPEQLNELDVLLQKRTGMTVKQVDTYSIMTVMSLITMKTFGCDDLKSYEMNFIEMAKQKSKKIAGLETVKSQMKSLENAYSNDEMMKMLKELNTTETTKWIISYKAENIQELYKDLTSEKLMSTKVKKYMLDERNLDWVESMPEMMKKESVFYAVGSAHLAGNYGVINLLRKKGYIVKPILN